MVSVILAVLTVLVTTGSHFASVRSWAMEERGRSATAEVVSRRYVHDEDDNETDYYVSYAFTFDGREVRTERSVSRALYDRSEQGVAQEVWFLPETPTRIDLSETEAAQNAAAARWIALVAGLATLGVFWVPARRSVAALRARRYGAQRRAEVLEVRKVGAPFGSRRYRLLWKDETGAIGQSMRGFKPSFSDLHRGDAVTVYVGATQTWWEGDLFT